MNLFANNENITQLNPADLFFTIFINAMAVVAIFSLLYFVIKNLFYKISLFRNFTLVKKIILHIILSILFSSISPILLAIGQAINSPYVTLTQVFALTVFSLFTSTFSIIGVFPIFLLSNIFIPITFDTNTFLLILGFFIISAFFVFVVRFFFSNSIKVVFISSVFYFAILAALVAILYSSDAFINMIINTIVNFVMFYLLYAIALTISNIIEKTYTLKTSIQYDRDQFIKPAYAKIAFEDYVKKNNISVGLFITFDIIGIEQIITAKGKNFADRVEKKFISYLVYSFTKKSFFFKTPENKYAIFLKIDENKINLVTSLKGNLLKERKEEDFILPYQKILNNLPTSILHENKMYDVKAIAFASIYGVHSNDFNELNALLNETKANLTLDEGFNVIQLYEYKTIDNISDYNSMLELAKSIDFDSFNVKLTEVWVGKNPNNVSNNFLDYTISSIKHGIYSKELFFNKYKNDLPNLSLLLRSFGLRALILFSNYIDSNQHSHYNLIIDYPIYEISKDEFSGFELIKKIKKHNLNLDKIILNLNVLNLTSLNDQTIKKIKNLNKEGIRFSFDNLDEKNLQIIKFWKPNYACIKNNYFVNENQKKHKEYLTKLIKFYESQNIQIIFR